MRFLVASDIHGSAYYCRKMLDRFEEEQADRLLLLGDLLYHGPRNDLPEGYAPKETLAMLNQYRERILAVRGNCDAEVDQMVLTFPILADYCILSTQKGLIYATHGHVYHADHRPPMCEGDALLHGHTHVWKAQQEDGWRWMNPGSVALPKEGNPPTYAILENGFFTVKTLDGTILGSV